MTQAKLPEDDELWRLAIRTIWAVLSDPNAVDQDKLHAAELVIKLTEMEQRACLSGKLLN